jgi:hypothetical protein
MLSLSRESVAIGTHEHLFSQCKLAYGDVDTWVSMDALSWIYLVLSLFLFKLVNNK